jgi:hypothetical protein
VEGPVFCRCRDPGKHAIIKNELDLPDTVRLEAGVFLLNGPRGTQTALDSNDLGFGEAEPKPKRIKKPRNYSWAQLMQRVFEVDLLICPGCGLKMRVLYAIHPPDAIQKILTCLGLPSRAPPIAPARPVVVEDRLFW